MGRSDISWRFCICVAAMNLMVGVAFVLVLLPDAAPPSVVAAIAPPTKVQPQKRIVPAVVGMPVHLSVSAVGVELAVIPGTYDPDIGDWTLSYSSALHADSSMPINDSNGVSLIYAHALPGLFGSLFELTPGMEARVATDRGDTFTYRYRSSKVVVPTDTAVFTAEGSPALVLQTCSGPWDTERTLFYFDLIGVESA